MTSLSSRPGPSSLPEDQASRLRQLVAQLQAAPAPASQTGPREYAPHAALSRTSPRHAEDLPAARRVPIVAITSGKGGVGKTNLAVNLAIALTQRHFRVSLLDADLGMANADVLCGLNPARRLQHALPTAPSSTPFHAGSHSRVGPTDFHTPSSASSPPAALASIAIPAPGGFWLVPGAVGVAEFARLSQAHQQSLIQGLSDLEQRSDIILIDTGAGIGPGVLSLLEIADDILVVVTPEPTSIADAYALIKCVLTGPSRTPSTPSAPRDPRLLVNQAESLAEAKAVHARIAKVCASFLSHDLALAGTLRHDPNLGRAVRARQPVLLHAPQCQASHDLAQLADHLALHLFSCPSIRQGSSTDAPTYPNTTPIPANTASAPKAVQPRLVRSLLERLLARRSPPMSPFQPR